MVSKDGRTGHKAFSESVAPGWHTASISITHTLPARWRTSRRRLRTDGVAVYRTSGDSLNSAMVQFVNAKMTFSIRCHANIFNVPSKADELSLYCLIHIASRIMALDKCDYYCVCVALFILRSFFFFSHPSHRSLRSLLLPENKRDWLETLTHWAMVSFRSRAHFFGNLT